MYFQHLHYFKISFTLLFITACGRNVFASDCDGDCDEEDDTLQRKLLQVNVAPNIILTGFPGIGGKMVGQTVTTDNNSSDPANVSQWQGGGPFIQSFPSNMEGDLSQIEERITDAQTTLSMLSATSQNIQLNQRMNATILDIAREVVGKQIVNQIQEREQDLLRKIDQNKNEFSKTFNEFSMQMSGMTKNIQDTIVNMTRDIAVLRTTQLVESAAFEGKLTKLETKLDQKAADLKAATERLDSRFTEFDKKIEGVRTDTRNHITEVSTGWKAALEEIRRANDERHGNVLQQYRELKGSISTIETKISTLADKNEVIAKLNEERERTKEDMRAMKEQLLARISQLAESERVTKVEERVTTAEKNIETVKAQSDTNKVNIESLKTGLANLQTSVDGAQKTTNEAIATTNTKIAQLESKQSVDARNQEQRVLNVTASLADTEKKVLDRITDREKAINDRITEEIKTVNMPGALQKIEDLRTSLTQTFETSLKTCTASCDKANSNFTQLKQKFDDMNGHFDEKVMGVPALSAELTKLGKDVSAASRNIHAVTAAAVGPIGASLDNVTKQMDALEKAIQERVTKDINQNMDKQISGLKDNLNTAEGKIADLTRKTDNLKPLEGRMDKVESDIGTKAAKEELAPLSKSIKELDFNLKEAKLRIDNLNTSTTDVADAINNRVTALERGYVRVTNESIPELERKLKDNENKCDMQLEGQKQSTKDLGDRLGKVESQQKADDVRIKANEKHTNELKDDLKTEAEKVSAECAKALKKHEEEAELLRSELKTDVEKKATKGELDRVQSQLQTETTLKTEAVANKLQDVAKRVGCLETDIKQAAQASELHTLKGEVLKLTTDKSTKVELEELKQGLENHKIQGKKEHDALGKRIDDLEGSKVSETQISTVNKELIKLREDIVRPQDLVPIRQQTDALERRIMDVVNDSLPTTHALAQRAFDWTQNADPRMKRIENSVQAEQNSGIDMKQRIDKFDIRLKEVNVQFNYLAANISETTADNKDFQDKISRTVKELKSKISGESSTVLPETTQYTKRGALTASTSPASTLADIAKPQDISTEENKQPAPVNTQETTTIPQPLTTQRAEPPPPEPPVSSETKQPESPPVREAQPVEETKITQPPTTPEARSTELPTTQEPKQPELPPSQETKRPELPAPVEVALQPPAQAKPAEPPASPETKPPESAQVQETAQPVAQPIQEIKPPLSLPAQDVRPPETPKEIARPESQTSQEIKAPESPPRAPEPQPAESTSTQQPRQPESPPSSPDAMKPPGAEMPKQETTLRPQELIKPPESPQPQESKPPETPQPQEVKPPEQPKPQEMKPPEQPAPQESKPPEAPQPQEVKPPEQPKPQEMKPPEQPAPSLEQRPPALPTPQESKPLDSQSPQQSQAVEQPKPQEVKPPEAAPPQEIKPPEAAVQPPEVKVPEQPKPQETKPPEQQAPLQEPRPPVVPTPQESKPLDSQSPQQSQAADQPKPQEVKPPEQPPPAEPKPVETPTGPTQNP